MRDKIKNSKREIVVLFVSLIALFIIAGLATSASAQLTKSSYIKVLEADCVSPTYCYVNYQLCNPSVASIIFNQKLSNMLMYTNRDIKSTEYFVSNNVTKYDKIFDRYNQTCAEIPKGNKTLTCWKDRLYTTVERNTTEFIPYNPSNTLKSNGCIIFRKEIRLTDLSPVVEIDHETSFFGYKSTWLREEYNFSRNVTYLNESDICPVNNTFDLGNPTEEQVVWVDCSNDLVDITVYYNNNTDYAFVDGSNTTLEWEVEYGNQTSNDPETLNSGINDIIFRYTMKDNKDSVGNYNASDTNVTYNESLQYDGGAYFDGFSSFMDTGYSPTNNQPFTISFWFQSFASNNTWERIYDCSDMNPYMYIQKAGYYAPYNLENHLRFLIRSPASADVIDIYSDNAVNDGMLHHAVITLNSTGNGNMYIDSVLQDNQRLNGNSANTWVVDGIIGSSVNSDEYFLGTIDDFRFYDAELTQAQIIQLYLANESLVLGSEQNQSANVTPNVTDNVTINVTYHVNLDVTGEPKNTTCFDNDTLYTWYEVSFADPFFTPKFCPFGCETNNFNVSSCREFYFSETNFPYTMILIVIIIFIILVVIVVKAS